MKILYVTTLINTVNAFLVPHIKFLIDKGHEVDVACNITREPSPDLLKLGCKIHNVEFERSPVKKGNFNAYKKIENIIRKEGYSLVHVHTPIASFLTRIASRNIPKLKLLYTAHGFHFLKGAPIKNWLIYYSLEKIASKWTDGLITINEEDYQISSKMNLRESNIYKTHGVGINLSRFTPQNNEVKTELRKKYKFDKNDFILMYAAELNNNKNQGFLIDTVYLLKQKIPNIRLLLAGIGPLKEHYELKIKNLGLQDNVILLGLRNDIPDLLKICDIAVASSKREGLPVNLMESMSTGLPLVVTNIRGHRDLVKNGENGFLVNLDDVDTFVNKINELYNSEELREQFRVENINKVKAYSVENVIKELSQIYKEVLSNNI